MQAYTRDPALLLRKKGQKGSVSIFAPPMNSSSMALHTQPVEYNDVTLARDVFDVAQGTFLSAAVVHWRTCEMQLYNADGQLVFAGTSRTITTKRYCNMFYLREVIEFLCRGHSILDSECRCLHKRDTLRASELGISRNNHNCGGDYDPESLRDGQCKLPSTRIARTTEEIAQEVALTNIEGLVPHMQNNPNILTLQGEKECLYAFKATYDTVNCKEELLHLVHANPLGIREPSARETYNTAPLDMQALADERRIYRLYNMETKTHICFPRAPHLELHLDEDIKCLWHQQQWTGSSVVVEQCLLQAGLQPMMQEEALPKKKKTRKS